MGVRALSPAAKARDVPRLVPTRGRGEATTIVDAHLGHRLVCLSCCVNEIYHIHTMKMYEITLSSRL